MDNGLFSPAAFRGLFGDFRPLLSRHAFRSRLAAHPPERHGGRILTVIRHLVLDLAGGDSSDHDRALVSVSGALFAFWSARHWLLSPCLALSITDLHQNKTPGKPGVLNSG